MEGGGGGGGVGAQHKRILKESWKDSVNNNNNKIKEFLFVLIEMGVEAVPSGGGSGKPPPGGWRLSLSLSPEGNDSEIKQEIL